ncbi:MAG: hypothetical protein C0615_05695 [Desulfuromonas sp.]|nr:MAG: hypothetical protein C0615_05695 [Desulfuromonas sp.]
MKRTEHDRICKMVAEGEKKDLEHHITHRSGKILSCTEDGFEVSVEGEESHWATPNVSPT